MNTIIQLTVLACGIHFALQQTFSSSPEDLQKISQYLLDHYDWLSYDLPVDSGEMTSQALEPVIVHRPNNVSVRCSWRDCENKVISMILKILILPITTANNKNLILIKK